MSEMNWEAGSWTCKTVKSMNPKLVGQSSTFTATAHPKYILATSSNDVSRIVYNAHLKKFVYIDTADDGTYVTATSPGYIDGKSTWTPILADDGDLSYVVMITLQGTSKYIFDVAKSATSKPFSESVCTKG
jgi:hypothetical protein